MWRWIRPLRLFVVVVSRTICLSWKKSFVWTQEEKKFYPPTPSFSAEAAVMSVIYFILREVYFLKVKSKTSCLQDCNFVRSTVHLNTASTTETSLKKSFVWTQREKKFYPPTPSKCSWSSIYECDFFHFYFRSSNYCRWLPHFSNFIWQNSEFLHSQSVVSCQMWNMLLPSFSALTISNLYNESPVV